MFYFEGTKMQSLEEAAKMNSPVAVKRIFWILDYPKILLGQRVMQLWIVCWPSNSSLMLNRIKKVENGEFSALNIIVMKSVKLEILTPKKTFPDSPNFQIPNRQG